MSICFVVCGKIKIKYAALASNSDAAMMSETGRLTSYSSGWADCLRAAFVGTALVLRLGSANGSFSANFAERRPADERFGVRTTFTLLSASISVTELLIRTFCLPRRMLVDLWRFYGIWGRV